jgi:hypothetical protein
MIHDSTNKIILCKNLGIVIFYGTTASGTLSIPNSRWRVPDHLLVSDEGLIDAFHFKYT